MEPVYKVHNAFDAVIRIVTQVLNARLKLLDIERSILAADLQSVHVDFFPMMVRVVFFSVGMMDIGEQSGVQTQHQLTGHKNLDLCLDMRQPYFNWRHQH
jgi:spore maturation protein SpmA